MLFNNQFYFFIPPKIVNVLIPNKSTNKTTNKFLLIRQYNVTNSLNKTKGH